MERKEVVISEGNGLQSTDILTKCIQAVCYIEAILKDDKTRKLRVKRGSGFYAKVLVNGTEHLGIFTNNHVLASSKEAVEASATFGYEGSNEGKKITLRPDLIFRTNKDLDYTFTGIQREDIEKLGLKIEPITMEPEPDIKEGAQIYVFQHPMGRSKEFSQDKILRIDKPYVLYKADTETGSSGSPVFTVFGLKLIAIHHKGSEELSYNKGTLCSEILSHLNSETYTHPSTLTSDSQDKEIYEEARPAMKVKMDHSECSAIPSDEDLDKLSQEIAPFYKPLGRRLKVPRGKLEEIAHDNIQYSGIKEKALQMLFAWVDMAPSPTCSELTRALRVIGQCRLANQFCDHWG